MGNAVIIAVLVLIVGLAVYSTVKRIRYGSSCCGEREPGEKKVRVKAGRNRYGARQADSCFGLYDALLREENGMTLDRIQWEIVPQK